LAEIAAAQGICQFEIGSRQYGAIRNFRKYQRPKKPNAIHPITDEIRTYVALTGVSSEPEEVEQVEVDPVTPVSGEKSPQMEDGGGKREEEGTRKALSAGADGPVFQDFWKAYPTDKNMSKKMAETRWNRLPHEKRVAALAAIPGFRGYCSANAWYRPIHAERFLSQERFEGYAADPTMTPEAIAAAKDRADRLLKRGKYAESYA
jgi:hypothetical protein